MECMADMRPAKLSLVFVFDMNPGFCDSIHQPARIPRDVGLGLLCAKRGFLSKHVWQPCLGRFCAHVLAIVRTAVFEMFFSCAVLQTAQEDMGNEQQCQLVKRCICGSIEFAKILV